MTMSTPDASIKVGMLVTSADGDELGRVDGIEDGCFKIDAPFMPDYWLAADMVDDVPEGIVRLKLSREALNTARRDGPEHEGMHLHRR